MRTFLLFLLYGPLASWGKEAVGEVRPTALRPTRSALLGLIGAALGLERGDDDTHRALGDELRFGVHVVSAGLPLTDYHTVQVKPGRRGQVQATRSDELRGKRHEWSTIVSTREYRTDACYRVAAWNVIQEPAFPLERLAAALEEPHFVLYLGRKSCPLAAPLSPQLVRAGTLVEAFAQADFPDIPFLHQGWSSVGLSPGRGLYWEGDSKIAGVEPVDARERRDDPLSRRRWSFQRRREHFAPLPTEPTGEEAGT